MVQYISAILEAHDRIFKLLVLIHEERCDVLCNTWVGARHGHARREGRTMAFWTTAASRDHLAMAYTFTTCRFIFTTKSASCRLRCASGVFGRLFGQAWAGRGGRGHWRWGAEEGPEGLYERPSRGSPGESVLARLGERSGSEIGQSR